MILHCMEKGLWDKRKHKAMWGESNIENDGFIHCASVEYFWRVCHKFNNCGDYVILCINEEKLISAVKYEDKTGCGREYPHIYGPVNNDAVVMVLPYLKDDKGNWIKNEELLEFEDR